MFATLLAAVPQPPVDAVMPKTAETFFNVFIFIPLGVGLGIAVRKLFKGQGPLLLYCIIGGALCAFFEPVVDVLGLAYMKEVGAVGTFTFLGRTMPLFICFVYPWYVGGMGYLAYKLFKRGVTMRDLYLLWFVDFVVDMVLESPGILAGTYLYYGPQPFNFWGFPLWWGWVNPVMPMVAGALIFHLRPHLNKPWKLPAIILCVPMADGMANGATALPIWAALNVENVSYFWTHVAALATLGLALFAVWVVGLSVAGRGENPHAASETLPQKLKAIVGFGAAKESPPERVVQGSHVEAGK
jgi:hypothetical protein